MVIPLMLRVDRGTETDLLTSMHCYLLQLAGNFHDNPDFVEENILYRPSTANKIERWWRELNDRLEKFFKVPLNWLLENGHYDRTDQLDRYFINFMLLFSE